MKMELPRITERFGSVRINNVQRVLLLDSDSQDGAEQTGIYSVHREDMSAIERTMAIVIPVKDERLKVIEGVISAIPQECLIIVVSNSKRTPVDRHKMELDMVEQYTHYTRRKVWLVHQRDGGLGKALKELNYTELLDDEGLVRNGKAEGMILGMLLAKAAGKEYVGFVDADNYIPGAVHEYVSIFAATFLSAKTPYSMVRILWSSKPKILENSLYFSRWGRVSEITNKYLNKLISSFSGFETEVVKTGNSGDHAISMKLAEMLEYKAAFAAETEEILTILEQFGGVFEPRSKEVMDKGVEIFQVETRNPHLHDEKGDEHIQVMLEQSLRTIMDSPLCPGPLKEEIANQVPESSDGRKGHRIRSFANVDTNSLLEKLNHTNSINTYA